MTATVHPYLANLGEGPYSFEGTFDLAEAMNPDSAANFGNMTGKTPGAPRLKAGLGTCTCCGRAITLICIVRTGNGDLYGVGSDCIEKIGHAGLCRGVHAALALRRKRQLVKRADAKRKAKWEEEAPAREAAQAAALKAAAEAKVTLQARLESWDAALTVVFGDWKARRAQAFNPSLERRNADDRFALFIDNEGRFYGVRWEPTILADILNGNSTLKGLNTRAVSILADIRGRDSGRRGSKAYEATYEAVFAAIHEIPA